MRWAMADAANSSRERLNGWLVQPIVRLLHIHITLPGTGVGRNAIPSMLATGLVTRRRHLPFGPR